MLLQTVAVPLWNDTVPGLIRGSEVHVCARGGSNENSRRKKVDRESSVSSPNLRFKAARVEFNPRRVSPRYWHSCRVVNMWNSATPGRDTRLVFGLFLETEAVLLLEFLDVKYNASENCWTWHRRCWVRFKVHKRAINTERSKHQNVWKCNENIDACVCNRGVHVLDCPGCSQHITKRDTWCTVGTNL